MVVKPKGFTTNFKKIQLNKSTKDKSAFFIKFYEESIPFHKFLGLKVLELKKGTVKMRFPLRPEFMGNIMSGHWHGGVLASALDAAGGMAAASLLTSVEDKLATLDIRVDYLKPHKGKALIVTGKVLRSGKSSIVTNLQAFDEESEELLADGRAVFSVRRASEK